MTQNNLISGATLAAAALALGALPAQAQGRFTTHGTIVAAVGDQVPGAPLGVLFGGSSTFDSGVIDDAGNVFFRGRLQGAGVLPTNERALFIGTNRTNLTMVVRSGDAVPTLTGGETLNTATGNGPGSSPRIAANGQMFWTSNLSGGASTTADDTAIFTGTPGNFVIAAREGGTAIGMTATFSTALGALSHQPTGMNSAGRILFQTATTGGDTTTANNAAWIGGTAGNLEVMFRKGHVLGTGEVVSALGFISQENASGQFLHEDTLSTTLGTPPATTANDKVLHIYTPGGTPGTGTNTLVMREGDAAPGTVGATFNTASNTWSPNAGAASFNNGGKALLPLDILNGDVVAGVNDRGLWLASTSGLTLVQRKGDVAPGAGGDTFHTVNNTNTLLNNNDRIAFMSTLSGGSVTTANDESCWTGPAGSLQMIAREGDPAPGTVGATFGSMVSLANFYINDLNQVTFQANTVGGDTTATNSQGFWAWDPVVGLTLLARKGDSIEVTPTVFKSYFTFGGIQFSNGDGRGLSLNDQGHVTMRFNFDDGTTAILWVDIPSGTGTSFCSGDGSGTACPCANSGTPGNGCANFNFASGAKLSAFGHAGASIGTDTLVLTTTNMPGPGLFFQGASTLGGGSVFGDGLLCAGGALTRMGVVFPTNNSASYPGGTTPAPIHIAGGTVAGDVRHYQVWYRDSGETSPGVSFCTPDTFNLTQGLTITWGP